MQTPRQRLDNAYDAYASGRYEFALAELKWFHHHALEYEPNMYGVRLSFALAHWVELGQHYPPAMRALREIRDETARKLVEEEQTFGLFHDLCSINQYLNEDMSTAAVVERLEKINPEFVERRAHIALEPLVRVGRYDLASKYLGDPEAAITEAANMYSRTIAQVEDHDDFADEQLEAMARNYANRVRLVLDVLRATDRAELAVSLEKRAISMLPNVRAPGSAPRAQRAAFAGRVIRSFSPAVGDAISVVLNMSSSALTA